MKSCFAALLAFIGMLMSTPALAKHHRCDAVKWTDGRYDNTTEVWGYDSIDPPARWGHRQICKLTKSSDRPYKGKPTRAWRVIHYSMLPPWGKDFTLSETHYRSPPPADWRRLELAPCDQMIDITFDVRESSPTTGISPEYRVPDPQAMLNLRTILAENEWLHYNDRTEGVRLTLTLSIKKAAEMFGGRYYVYEASPGKRAVRTVHYSLLDTINAEIVAVGPTNQWFFYPNVPSF